jgi:hypothetical protein
MDVLSDFECVLLEYAVRGQPDNIHALTARLKDGYTLANMVYITKVVLSRLSKPYPLMSFDEYANEYLTSILLVTGWPQLTLVWRDFGIHLYRKKAVVGPGDRVVTTTREHSRLRSGGQRWLVKNQEPCAILHLEKAPEVVYSLTKTDANVVFHPTTRLGVNLLAFAARGLIPSGMYALLEWHNASHTAVYYETEKEAISACVCSLKAVASVYRYKLGELPELVYQHFGIP